MNPIGKGMLYSVSMAMFLLPLQAQDPVRSSLDVEKRAAHGSATRNFMKLLTGQDGSDAPAKDVLKKTRERGETELEKVQKMTQLLVVKGHFDMVEKVLTSMNIKYDAINPTELPAKDLSKYTAVFINCLGEPTGKKGKPIPQKAGLPIPGEMAPLKNVPDALKSKLRTYVENGGYLYTDDWAAAMTAAVFPEYLKTSKHIANDKDTVTVPVQAYKPNEDHPFLKDVFSYGDKGQGSGLQKKIRMANWVVDGGCLSFEIVPAAKEKVDILLVSDPLKKYGTDLIAVTFTVGKGIETGKASDNKPGVVFHVLGHFYQQGLGNKNNDEVAKMYQMIVNFVLEAEKAHNTISKK